MFFFFKQKTAYEMRISDWSSDVCSSDLLAEAPDQPGGKRIGERPVRRDREQRGSGAISHARSRLRSPESPRGRRYRTTTPDGRGRTRAPPRSRGPRTDWSKTAPRAHRPRSEEHTSELPSLMRISYAVFCLKKKQHKCNQP